MSLPAPIELIPHRPPMLLLDEVSAWDNDKIRCKTTIRADNPFVRGGRASSVLAIELFAQSASALVGLIGRMRGDGGESLGALLGTREIQLHEPWLEVGDELVIECEQVLAIEAAAQIQCALIRNGETIARGSVNVMAGEPRR